MPALQSAWFAPHVTSYVIAYGLLAVSAVLVVMSFRAKAEERLLAADEVVRLAFPFLTFGLWSGALWADVAWARYWAWDIKEAWALITWCVYLLYFHVRAQAAFAGWRRPLLLLGFVAVLVTFFVVNLLPAIQSIHSYAR
jgi:ABC-type transport system involved in cytochrome c biogenesis permease subunit